MVFSFFEVKIKKTEKRNNLFVYFKPSTKKIKVEEPSLSLQLFEHYSIINSQKTQLALKNI
jgi:hypothetical protein